MDPAFSSRRHCLGRLGIGLACLLTRLKDPRPGAEPAPEDPAAQAPATGD